MSKMYKFIDVKDYYPEIQELSIFLKTILYSQGWEISEIKKLLELEKNNFESPFKIFDVKNAVKKINEYIKNGYKILIYGDFDVDGVCATTILWDYLYRYKKANVLPFIPNRFTDGYGLNSQNIEKIINDGFNVIITVDCGIRDIELVEKYKNKIKFIITDHHSFATDIKGEVILPAAEVVVHPEHPKSKFSSPISGATTAWEIIRGFEMLFPTENFEYKDIVNQYLDLVALSIISDIIPITNENRKIYKEGIKLIQKPLRIGLKELIKISGIENTKINDYHIGYIIGPRLNAPGRITDNALDSVRLLATKSPQKAQKLAQKLNDINRKRQNITYEFFNKALKLIDETKKVIVILGDDWPEGILGLIAGKLTNKFNKATFVATKKDNLEIKGSSRSKLEYIHLNEILDFAKKHLTKYGGHKRAAGFASTYEKFLGFEDTILTYFNKYKNEPINDVNLITIENPDYINVNYINEMSIIEPFGSGNEKPLFLLKDFKILDIKYYGQNNQAAKLIIGKKDKKVIVNIFELNTNISFTIGDKINPIGHLQISNYKGKNEIELNCIEILN